MTIRFVQLVAGLGAMAVARAGFGQADFSGLAYADDNPAGAACAVSANGQVVLGTGAYRWTLAGGMSVVSPVQSPPSLTANPAMACSSDGNIVVGTMCQNLASNWGFVWTAATGPLALSSITGGSLAYGVADNMTVAGATISPSPIGPRAALWRSSTGWLPIAPAPSTATDITSDGAVAVGYAGSGGAERAFRWRSDGLTYIAPARSYANAVSADGGVVVGIASLPGTTNVWQPFRWTAGTGVAPLANAVGDGRFGEAYDVCDDGSRIVGTASVGDGSYDAFICEGGGPMHSLRRALVCRYGLGPQLAGWDLTSASGISRDGTVIVGSGRTEDVGFERGWLARVPRCPGDNDHDGRFTPADIGAFIGDWFWSASGGADWGDFDLDGAVTPADVAAFVGAWFAAITGACS